MQIALFSAAAGDAAAIEEINRFLRGHRVLTLDRQCHAGVWSFCISYQLGALSEGRPAEKVDYKQVLDGPTFAIFSRLRELRKSLAEKDRLPPYAVFTNEQLAQMARARCASAADLDKIEGVGSARIEKYGTAALEAIRQHDQQQSQA